MSRTLLQGVNEVLKRLGDIKSNSGELSSLTDSQRQVQIDLAVQVWNEVILDLYDSCEEQLPKEMSTSTITLATGDRDYSLPTDMTYIRWPLKNDSNGYLIQEYPGGWQQMLLDQLQPANFTGRPFYGCIRPSDGLLYLDRIPTAADNGLAYTLYYDKSLIMSSAASVYPFSDDVFTELVPAVAEKIKMERDNQSDAKYSVSEKKYSKSMGKAAAKVSMNVARNYYSPDRGYGNTSDPMDG